MTPRFIILEKLTSLLLVIWGCFNLYVIVYSYYHLFNYYFDHGILSWKTISLFKFIKRFHLDLLIPLVSIFAGIFLALNKKIGWISALIILALTVLQLAISFLKNTPTLKNSDTAVIFSSIFIGLVFLLLFFSLIMKPFRIKYAATHKIAWAVIVITGLIILDNLFL